MFKAEIHSLSEINHIAALFLQAHPADRIFAFYGSMGAGKTTFIKALCEELQVLDYVTSPTFSLINEYQTKSKGTIFHFDFYIFHLLYPNLRSAIASSTVLEFGVTGGTVGDEGVIPTRSGERSPPIGSFIFRLTRELFFIPTTRSNVRIALAVLP